MKLREIIGNVWQYIAWLAVKCIIGVASLLPLCILFPVFRGLSTVFRVLGVRRRIVRANLRAALGKELSELELARIERDCYTEYGRILAEILASDRLLRKKDQHFELIGREIIDEAVSNGKGLLILLGHIGNFVVAAHYLRSVDLRMAFIAKKIANKYINREAEAMYSRHGNKVISIRSVRNDPVGGAKLFRSLKQGELVVALIDQNAGRQGTLTTFFGLPTYLPGGPAALACRGGVPVITGFITREGDRIRLKAHPPIDYSSATSTEEAVDIILGEYSRRLEEAVRKHPEQYFWFHKKWKTHPEIREQY